jgi:hypothetical protein
MDKFFAFIDMVDDNSSGIPNYVIEDLCNGTISLKDWQNDIVKLRREFEKSMFVNCVEKTHFKEHLVKVAVNFQSIIKMYRNIIRTSCINGKKDIETNKKEYYINVCHHFMCAQLELAYRQIKYSMSDLEEMIVKKKFTDGEILVLEYFRQDQITWQKGRKQPLPVR